MLQERCDDYVRLIKLTLDESIREQNTLLNGSAIHNRLKCLGLVDCKSSCAAALPVTCLDFKHRGKYVSRARGDFNNRAFFGRRPDKAIVTPDSSVPNNDDYNTDLSVHDSSRYCYDDHRSTGIYDEPRARRFFDDRGYRDSYTAKSASFRHADQEYRRAHYFPTSKPTAQYPRETAGRFYRRKPVEQYPREEVPSWRCYPGRPVNVVAVRQPRFYDFGPPAADRGHRCGGDPSDYYLQTDDLPYNNRDDHNYYYSNYCCRSGDAADSAGNRSFAVTVTRPCSPVYCGSSSSGRDGLADPAGCCSLLEKKIGDYVWWNPPTVEKHAYRPDFKPAIQTESLHQAGDKELNKIIPCLPGRSPRRHLQTSEELQSFARSRNASPEKNYSALTATDPPPPSLRDDRSTATAERKNEKKRETPARLVKRISFDLDDDRDDRLRRRLNLTGKCAAVDDGCSGSAMKDAVESSRLVEKDAKTDESPRQNSTTLPRPNNNDYSAATSQQRDQNYSRRPSVAVPGKLTSDHFESNNNFQKDLDENVDSALNAKRASHDAGDNDDDATSFLKFQRDADLLQQYETTFDGFPNGSSADRRCSDAANGGRKAEACRAEQSNFDPHSAGVNVVSSNLQSRDDDVAERTDGEFEARNESDAAADRGGKNSIETDSDEQSITGDNAVSSPAANRTNGRDDGPPFESHREEDDGFDGTNAAAADCGAQNCAERLAKDPTAVSDDGGGGPDNNDYCYPDRRLEDAAEDGPRRDYDDYDDGTTTTSDGRLSPPRRENDWFYRDSAAAAVVGENRPENHREPRETDDAAAADDEYRGYYAAGSGAVGPDYYGRYGPPRNEPVTAAARGDRVDGVLRHGSAADYRYDYEYAADRGAADGYTAGHEDYYYRPNVESRAELPQQSHDESAAERRGYVPDDYYGDRGGDVTDAVDGNGCYGDGGYGIPGEPQRAGELLPHDEYHPYGGGYPEAQLYDQQQRGGYYPETEDGDRRGDAAYPDSVHHPQDGQSVTAAGEDANRRSENQ